MSKSPAPGPPPADEVPELKVRIEGNVRSDELKPPTIEPRQGRFYDKERDQRAAQVDVEAQLRESLDFPITVDNALDDLEIHLTGALAAIRIARAARKRQDKLEAGDTA